MICRKLNYRVGQIDPDSTEIVILHTTDNVQFGYDVENGEIKVSLNRENLTESVRELKKWMADNKIPFSFQDDSMFYIDVAELDVAELNMGDVPLLESEGFVKKETENGNSINFIWELHE